MQQFFAKKFFYMFIVCKIDPQEQYSYRKSCSPKDVRYISSILMQISTKNFKIKYFYIQLLKLMSHLCYNIPNGLFSLLYPIWVIGFNLLIQDLKHFVCEGLIFFTSVYNLHDLKLFSFINDKMKSKLKKYIVDFRNRKV